MTVEAGSRTRNAVVDRSRLPQIGRSAPYPFPPIHKSTPPDGPRIWTAAHRSVPVVTVTLLLSRGAADDPPGQEGLAALTIDMLDEGSGGRTAVQMHEALGRIGADLDSDIGADAAVLTVSVLSRFTGEALRLLADMAARPALTEADFARVRDLRLHRLKQIRDMPAALADRAFAKLLYADHPYGHTPLGLEPTLAGLSVDDVRAFHRRFLTPSEATLVVVGDCEHDQIEPLARDAFAHWQPAPIVARPVAAPLPRPPRLNIVARKEAPQSELRIGHVAVARDTPDYHALVAANMVLGGQFVSRINMNLRENKGYTYGARTSFDFRRLPGPFTLQASVHTAATASAIAESLAEIAGIRGQRPVTADELTLGVAALTRGFARNFETAEQVARAVLQIAQYGLPDDYFVQFVPNLERVTVDDVTRVASTCLDPDRLTTLVVGDDDVVGPDLAGLALGEPFILPPGGF